MNEYRDHPPCVGLSYIVLMQRSRLPKLSHQIPVKIAVCDQNKRFIDIAV